MPGIYCLVFKGKKATFNDYFPAISEDSVLRHFYNKLTALQFQIACLRWKTSDYTAVP